MPGAAFLYLKIKVDIVFFYYYNSYKYIIPREIVGIYFRGEEI